MAVKRSHTVDIVRFDQVSTRYPNRQEGGIFLRKNPFVLQDISFSCQVGGFYFLSGPSGSGKTTLLKLIYKEVLPTQGTLQLFGKNVLELSPQDISNLRQKIGLVFQDCRLIRHLSILDNVLLCLKISGKETRHSVKNATELLDWVGLSGRYHDYPDQLSDGEKQRASIVRAMISHPYLLLADEPTAHVDDQTAYKLLHLFEELNKNGTTVIIATHNLSLIDHCTRRHHVHLTLSHGRLQEPKDYYQKGQSYDV